MSNEGELMETTDIYRMSYLVTVADDTDVLDRAWEKAEDFDVCGYMVHTQGEHAVSGILEGTLENLKQMKLWLEQEAPEGSVMTHFSEYQQQLKAKYDEFFCC